jgi:hypothetical protein
MSNTTVHHCKFYKNGSGMTLNVNKLLADAIKTKFVPYQDYNAVFDSEKGTLLIFKAQPPI